ncbi:MAG: hypothetical protein QOH05_1155 [Acetobacteraceae bacterium]|nr:hypothetical protein [Acetobacteraceae bacterium]
MSYSDAFALKNSGLNEFLFAEVGTELNGSPLTILSVLARLGQDPWVEALRWTKLPKPAVIDCLANSISQMPLSPQALVEARATATRLIPLLPSQMSQIRIPLKGQNVAITTLKTMPKWLLAALCGAVALGVAFGMSQALTTTDPGTQIMQPLSSHKQAPSSE